MSAARIAILDYGMGNLRSVEKALEHVGASATISFDPAVVRSADGVVLPGVGAFPRAMERIRERGLDRLIAERRDAGVPILGICLGLQLLFDSTTELGGADGLGLLGGPVGALRAEGLKVPHIGWSPVRWERDSRLTDGIDSETPFYFVHSFAPSPGAGELLGSAVYGERFACAAERDNVFGVQFHPEKSSAAGLRLLSNFAGVCAAAPDPGVILYPAIDIRGGAAVRLMQGDYARETTYDADPVDAAARWAAEGAEFLHVVDLDGAKAGEPRNLEAVRRIAAAVECPIQVGGGVRDRDAVAAVLGAGAARVVIGTAALRDPEFLDEVLKSHGDKVVVSVDARGGKVSLSGWTEATEQDVAATVAELGERGVSRFLCTEIDVDGTMDGPALGELERIAAATSAQVIASGGVGTLADLEALAGAGRSAANLEGAIVGRALYERRFSVAEGRSALR